jgi:hypothetical protein
MEQEPVELVLLILGHLLARAPMLLVYLIGIVLALVWWRRYPAVSALTFAAMGLLLLLEILSTTTFAILPSHLVRDRQLRPEQYSWILMLVGVVLGLLRAFLFGLLLIAIFIGRKPKFVPGPMEHELPASRHRRLDDFTRPVDSITVASNPQPYR